MLLFGKNQVLERLKAQPKTVEKIFFSKTVKSEEIKELAEKKRIACSILEEKEFLLMAKNANTQGIIAQVKEFVYADLDELLSLEGKDRLILVALSNITDPQNLGSMLRSAACFGKIALIIPAHRAAGINETVLRVSCGGENYVPVVQVTNLINAIEKAKKAGYWVAGSVVEQGQDVTSFKFPFPLFLVIGAEDKGIRKGMLDHLDHRLTLPMPGQDLSLNAAVAAAIFFYEITKQRLSAGG